MGLMEVIADVPEAWTARPGSNRNLRRSLLDIYETKFSHSNIQRLVHEKSQVDPKAFKTLSDLVLEGVDGL